jgi:ABC-type spermidine/putrescine transport system permease subunit II
MILRHLIRLFALGVLAYLALPLVVILGSSFTATPYLAPYALKNLQQQNLQNTRKTSVFLI